MPPQGRSHTSDAMEKHQVGEADIAGQGRAKENVEEEKDEGRGPGRGRPFYPPRWL